jgi:hypothetical protein
MKNTMKLFAVAAIAMVVAVIVIIMNTVSMDKKVANAYVAAEFGENYTASVIYDKYNKNGYIDFCVCDETGHCTNDVRIDRDYYTNLYF